MSRNCPHPMRSPSERSIFIEKLQVTFCYISIVSLCLRPRVILVLRPVVLCIIQLYHVLTILSNVSEMNSNILIALWLLIFS